MKKSYLVAVLLTLAVMPVPAGDPDGADPTHRVLQLLHDGRFDEAERVVGVGEEARSAFLRAFVTYWRALFDDENEALRLRLEHDLDRAVADGEARLENPRDPGEVHTWLGSARLLRAQLYASQGHPLKAAFEAKQARRLLREALDNGSRKAEALFGLGTYDYYASRVSAIVKGLRFLLALPGGDRKRGLDELEQAARESRYFGTEARILLVTIYSGRHERDYSEALRQAELLLGRGDEPSVAALQIASLLNLSLARPREAARQVDRALARARRYPQTDPAVITRLAHQRARAEIALFRPDLALERLRPLLTGGVNVPESLQGEVRALAHQAAAWSEPPGWYRALEHSEPAEFSAGARRAAGLAREALEKERRGELEEAVRELTALAGSGDVPELDVLAGRALLNHGRQPARALSFLSRAEGSADLTPAWRGPARLMAGRAADLVGQRQRAIDYYRSALEAPPFNGRDAAWRHRREAYDGRDALELSAAGLGR